MSAYTTFSVSAARATPAPHMFVNTPYSADTATRSVPSAVPLLSIPTYSAAFTEPNTPVNRCDGTSRLYPSCAGTMYAQATPYGGLSSRSVPNTPMPISMSYGDNVTTYANLNSCSTSQPMTPHASTRGESRGGSPSHVPLSSGAFFSVGNMGPSTWQTLVPTAMHNAMMPAYVTPSSNMASALGTPMRSFATAPDELPETDRSDTNLVVRHIPHHIVESDIHAAFDRFGDVTSAAIMRNIHSGESLGTAFVRYATHAEAVVALQTFQRWIMDCACTAAAAFASASVSGSFSLSDSTCPLPVHRVPATQPTGDAAAAAGFDAVFGASQAPHLTITWARREHDENTLTADERARVRKLFIRNVPTTCTKRSLQKLFRRFGRVGHISIHRDNKSSADKNNHRNIAFVVYDELGAAELATEAVHNTTPFPDCKGIRLMIKMTYDGTVSPTAATTAQKTASAPETTKTPPTARKANKPGRKERMSTATTTNDNDDGAAAEKSVKTRATASAAAAPRTSKTPGRASARADDGLEHSSRSSTGTESLPRMCSMHPSVVTSAAEEALDVAPASIKHLISDGSGSGSLPTYTTLATGGISSEPVSNADNSMQSSQRESDFPSEDFLLHAQGRSPIVLGSPAAARRMPPALAADLSMSSSLLDRGDSGNRGITVTVRRGGRVQRVMYSESTAASE